MYDTYQRVAVAVRARSNEVMEVFSPKPQSMDGINMLLDILTIPVAAGGAMFFKNSMYLCPHQSPRDCGGSATVGPREH